MTAKTRDEIVKCLIEGGLKDPFVVRVTAEFHGVSADKVRLIRRILTKHGHDEQWVDLQADWICKGYEDKVLKVA
jgi:hypothetical protein